MKDFFIHFSNGHLSFSASQVFKKDSKVFLFESNKRIRFKDIVELEEGVYDIRGKGGFYVLVVFDQVTQSLIAQYGQFSYCHSLYWYKTEESFYLDLSLKHLLKSVGTTPKLDMDSVEEFIRFGFVNGEKCLVKDIKKLSALKTLVYQKGQVGFRKSRYLNRASEGNYADNLRGSLPSNQSKAVVFLSGGFDSTFLTYLMKDNKELVTITAGSEFDPRKELSVAKNTASYLHLRHESLPVGDSWIKYLPQIVELQEGEMFDGGLILCYALVEGLKKLNLTDHIIVSGDGSDQFLNVNFHRTDLDRIPQRSRYANSFLERYPRHFFYYLIVKKLEWILRNNDLQYETPFITKNFLDCAKGSRSKTKKGYKAFVRDYLPKEISKPLSKWGGLVAERYYIPPEIYARFLEIVEANKNLFQGSHLDIRVILYKMYVLIFKYIFIDGHSIEGLTFDQLLENLSKSV